MRMFVRLVFGLFVLKAAVASPRFSRQANLDIYDDPNYDDLNAVETEDPYDYEDGLTIDEPEIETETTTPPDYTFPEEEKPEEEEEEELVLKPQAIPQGSGGSGVLMGPETHKEVELRRESVEILHVSGDFGGSASGSGTSGASGASGSGESGDLPISGDIILTSGASERLFSSEGSGESLLTEEPEMISGDVSGSGFETYPSGDSGDFTSGGSGTVIEIPVGSGESGESGDLSGVSSDPSISGASGSSGVSGDPAESGDLGITLISGEEEPLVTPKHDPQEAIVASGEISGASGTSEPSGDASSADTEISGTSGVPDVSASGDTDDTVTVIVKTKEEERVFPTTPETPQEGATSIEETDSSGLPDTFEPEEPDEPKIDISGMPTCLLCTCLGTSVYCDDLRLENVPPLPKETTHFYARYNKITKINKSDFASMNKLKRVDLTANEITSIDGQAFIGLPDLEELIVRQNHLTQLPALPETMTLIDASHNSISWKGIHKEAFKDMTGLLYLYLSDNNIDYIPVPLPHSLRSLHLQRNNIQMMNEDTFCNLNDFNYIRNALEDIRLDGNPINLSKTPQAYVCLPRIPIGNLI
ncbi:Epiphycan [Oryzias melastigma]|uniref:Epiphycan n=1 Tax=Oryzias melastigma TaxID=30732 RepID=A0A834FAH1_ORYME|nr:Epiphycan [Oryzias melastigma]